MRFALLAAAAAALFGTAAPAVASASSSTRPSDRPEGTLRQATLRPEAKYTLQRSGGERFGSVARQTGHFSAPFLIVASTEGGSLHRFQAATGTYQDDLGSELPDGNRILKPQALSSFGKEFWVADGADGSLHRFYGFDPRHVERFESASLKSPVLQLHLSDGDGSRLLFVLDRQDDQLVLVRYALELKPATGPDLPDGLELGQASTLALGPIRGNPTLIEDADGSRIVLINGSDVRAWNFALEEAPAPFDGSLLSAQTAGAGLLACSNSLDKGYWFVAEAQSAATTLRFMSYESGAPRGTIELSGLDWSAGFTFDRSNMALFPRGAIFVIENNAQLKGYAWDEIVRSIDLRPNCF